MAQQAYFDKSYNKIDYSVRPAKCIERKMLCESLQKLSPFGNVKNYRYIGFGSPFFCDFVLFHKILSIENMVCIEKEEDDKERFEFNKPFSCIEMKYGHSNIVLPTLKWDIRSIVWLDYDFTLNKSILKDIRHIFSTLTIGSVVIITVDGNVKNKFGKKIKEGKRLKFLKANVGEEKVPIDISEKNLNGWNVAKIFKRIITNEILKTIRERNGGRSKGNKLIYRQLYNFHYDDGTKMLTVGGIIFDEGTLRLYNQCNFNELRFIKVDDVPHNIIIPKLTLQEIKLLNKYLPTKFNKAPEFIPNEHKKNYKEIYQCFPHFFETEIY